MESVPTAHSAIVFPGIGPTRFADVARFMLVNPAARRLTAIADETLGYSLLDRLRAAGDGGYSEPVRVAFLLNCLALAEWAEDALGVEAQVVAGASFGGTAAAVHSGALDAADAVTMTAAWGRKVDEYFAREHRDVVTQSFARTPHERLDEVLAELDDQGEWYDVACHVDHDFHMLSVREDRLDWLRERLRAAGGLPLYTMRPPMHCDAFGPLRDTIEDEVMAGIRFADPRVPVVSDHDGSLVRTGEGLRELVLDAVVRTVRWPTAADTFGRLGVRTVHVCGQDALWGRVACMTGAFEVTAVKPETAMRPRRRSAVA